MSSQSASSRSGAAGPFGPHDLYVSTAGNDRWSGRLPEPNAAGTDGPLATLAGARDRVRALKLAGALPGALRVWVRGGRYRMTAPLRFGPEDSAPVTYAAYPGEQPVLDGGRPITGWRVEQRQGREEWVVDLPEVAEGKWYFRQLFVAGGRRPRAHLPKVTREQPEWYWIEDVPGFSFTAGLFDGTDSFVARAGDIREWQYLTDAEVVVLHYWIEERMPIASFDPQTRRVRSTRHSTFSLKDDFTPRWAKYYVDNVFEGLTEPGEWYLERTTGRLHYLPMPGEDPETTEVVAPVALQLLLLEGRPEAEQYVEFLGFEGLGFENTDWVQPSGGGDPNGAHLQGVELASAAQSAFNVPGVIRMEGARFCSVQGCVLRNIGWYGIELSDGCVGNRVVGNEITEMGAGGVRLGGADASGPRSRRTGGNRITDNEIHHGGRVFHSAAGVLAMHAYGNTIAHNHIHHFYYSAISCGWVWGYTENVSRDNVIEKNHLHDLGQRWLSDMGGIYLLGVQPGTRVRGNLIHDIQAHNYGGWAIYPDEGSSHLVIEGNVCYNAASNPFNQHFGRENSVRNNLFAFGGECLISLGRAGTEPAFLFERNILISRGEPLFKHGYGSNYSRGQIRSDLNLFWRTDGEPPTFRPRPSEDVDLAGWQALGNDRHSLCADPRCRDLERFDFTLAADSPAFGLGFEPIDLSDVGPRPREHWGE